MRRRALSTQAFTDVSLASGGRSVAFKVTLADGSQALYKVEQTFAAYWYSELASYYLDRLLGLGRVPPAIGRKLAWSELRAAAAGSPNVDEVVIQRDGSVRGAMLFWVPGELVPLAAPDGWEIWLRVEPPARVSPFQREADYRRAPRAASSLPNSSDSPASAAAAEYQERAAELSDLIVFDYLTANHDRWGGGFTNVRTLGPGGPLIAIDNANGFPPAFEPPNKHSEAKLEAVQRFRKRTARAIENLQSAEFASALAEDPLAPLLEPAQLQAFEQRRLRVLAYIREMQRKFGEHALVW